MDEGTLKTPVVFTGHFCLGWCSNFVGSEFGQKQSVKLLQNMVYNTTTHPPSHTLSVNTVHLLWEGGGEVREKVEGQKYTNIVPSSNGSNSSQAGSKIPTNE
jgi:hypothetical protein